MDATPSNGADVFVARSTNQGSSWGAPVRINDDVGAHDQFNQWLSVDPVTGAIDVSWDDTRNDPQNVRTDVYLSSSSDAGVSFAANTKVTDQTSDERAANPCAQRW